MLTFMASPGLSVSSTPYLHSNDKAKHMHVIEELAEELHRPTQEVAGLYEDILGNMRANAKIQDYLPILVSKRVKRLLK